MMRYLLRLGGAAALAVMLSGTARAAECGDLAKLSVAVLDAKNVRYVTEIFTLRTHHSAEVNPHPIALRGRYKAIPMLVHP